MKIDKLLDNDGKFFDGPLIIKNNVLKDFRGFFQETWSQKI